MTWNPELYLRYADDRTRPFADLIARVPGAFADIVDLGCGPGHLMPLLRARWPDARFVGVDASAEMIEAATAANDDPAITFLRADLTDWQPETAPGLIVSNATLQWVPEQRPVLARLRAALPAGGVLAFSVPNNFDAPSHVLLRELAARPAYAPALDGVAPRADGVSAAEYLEFLAAPGWTIDAWSTTYLHVLPGENAVFDWISGSGARPVLQALPDDLRERFAAEYSAALRDAYPWREYGTVLPFRREFVVCREVGSGATHPPAGRTSEP